MEKEIVKFSEVSCREFIETLASKAPVPGGGGAAALIAAVGAALCNMVGSLTLGKKKYADVQDDIKALMEKSTVLQEELICLIDRDAEVFEPLSKAYSMPSGTPEEAAEKDRVMEECLRNACEPPFQVIEKCCEILDLIGDFAEKGSSLAISDVGCAASCIKSALKGAALNVYINTQLMKDRQYAAQQNLRCDALIGKYDLLADAHFGTVWRRLRKKTA